MNIMARLTLRHLRENMKRTVVTILGIVMATSLITAILIGCFSAFKFFGDVEIHLNGNVHAVCYKVTEEQYNSLKEDSRIESVGLLDNDPTISAVRLCCEGEDRFRVGNVVHGDAAYLSAKVTSDYEGTLPTSSSEIAVEQKFLDDNGLNLSVGDTLTFEEGNRYSVDTDGELIYWAGNYRSEESFDTLDTVTCTITAVLHGNYPTRGNDVLRGIDQGYFPEQDNALIIFTLKKCDHTANAQVNDIVRLHGIEHCSKNNEYFIACFSFESGFGGFGAFFSMMLVGLAIVVVTSVILIVNSFGMSLAERMRYLGMLASVGATGKQKRFSVYFEGFILGVIGIPLGLLAGILGTKITLLVLGSKMLEVGMVNGAENMSGGIPLYTSPLAILAVTIVSSLTILISLLAPAIRASRVMPVDALRQVNTIKVKARKLRTNPLVRKLLGYEGELALKNIKRNGMKSKVISFSITVSVILFLTIDYFCESADKVNKYDYESPYQVCASCYYDEKDMLMEDLAGIDGINDIYICDFITFRFKAKVRADGEIEDTVLANASITDPSFRTDDFKDLNIDAMAALVVDDDDFREILDRNGLDEDKYFGGSLNGLLLNSYFHKTNDKPVFNERVIGQSLFYDEAMGNPPAIEVGDLIPYESGYYAFEIVPKESFVLIVPESMYYKSASEVLPDVRQVVSFGIETDEAARVEQDIEDLFAEGKYEYYYSADITQSLAIMNTVTLILKVSMYGFTTLLTLVAVANIINTISTGILLRRKEFAMYRSVGMDERGFKKMIRLETFLYGIKAIVFGIPVSILLSYLMYSKMEGHLFAFVPNYRMYPIVIATVFGVIGLSMLMSMNKIKNDEIIDVLKEDIC
ncbi:MAG: ABC transporter permease [Lachnospiraceae bacterium]|nr:ABC transporter permease [Lachnospiraceae bacterium]